MTDQGITDLNDAIQNHVNRRAASWQLAAVVQVPGKPAKVHVIPASFTGRYGGAHALSLAKTVLADPVHVVPDHGFSAENLKELLLVYPDDGIISLHQI